MIKLLKLFYVNYFFGNRNLVSYVPGNPRPSRGNPLLGAVLGVLLRVSLGTSDLAYGLEHEVRHRSSCEGLGTLTGACRFDAVLGNSP